MNGCEASDCPDKSCPRRLTELYKTDANGGALIISEAHFRTRVYELNPVGFCVWQLCDGHRSIREICVELRSSLTEESAPSVDQTENDVTRFIAKLREEWLVEWTSCS